MSIKLSSSAGLTDIANWCNAESAKVSAAAASNAPRLVVSGRLSSGKDVVAAAVMEQLGYCNSVQVSFASALRKELGELLEIARLNDLDDTVAKIAAHAAVSKDDAATTASLLHQATRLNPTVTPYTRTREMRLALQAWGTEVRRHHDGDYWVKRGALDVIDALSDGKAVHITDARFINEIEVAKALGFWAIRLEVDPAIRAKRLLGRDGLTIDPVSENHPSEVELESFNGFDQRVSNNGSLNETVAAIISAMR
jgi:hypothetical protein